MSFFEDNNPCNYIVRVRAAATAPRTYLFGSDTVQRRFDGKFTLVIRVPNEGESVRIKAVGPGDPFDVCTLNPGQVFAVSLFNLSSVWADQPDSDTRVHCAFIANAVA